MNEYHYKIEYLYFLKYIYYILCEIGYFSCTKKEPNINIQISK